MEDSKRSQVQSPEEITAILELAFADVNGFTKQDWSEIEKYAHTLGLSGLFKGKKDEAMRCYVTGFVLWFENEGFVDDDRIPELGHS